MSKCCFLDLDGVLADFVGGACRLHGRDPATVDTWDFYKPWGMTPKNFFGPMGFDFWKNLDPLPYASEVIETVCDYFGRKNIALLSSPVHTLGCDAGKRAWVMKWLPAFADRLFLGTDKSVFAFDGAVLIDDSAVNVDAFWRRGGQGLLFRQPWNTRGLFDRLKQLKEDLSWI